ncbi:hypothetical protein QAD02_015131 [Eretmocerus hayati]|uniref:Uncharacterized protein n=1 Tax=Eretmocerus hayati TaxID=131215 RepID=A0ACC2P6Z7_9HYME|nr:hypothetical protein QAD02_015131 [Eretmocerus hayati]
MPDNARRWLPGAPGGWFPSPGTAAEPSDSESEASSREPSPERPCRASSRASTEPDIACPQGSVPSQPTNESLREDRIVSPPHVIAKAVAWTQTCRSEATMPENRVSSDKPPRASENQARPCSVFASHACASSSARSPARENAAGPRLQPPPEAKNGAGLASLPPPAAVLPIDPSRPVHRCSPRIVPLIDLAERDQVRDDEVQVLYENVVNPMQAVMPRTISFDYERFRDLVNEYEPTLNPRIGAEIRSMTTIQDARTPHREVIRRGRARRRAQEREQLQLITDIAGAALAPPVNVAEEDQRGPEFLTYYNHRVEVPE